jgi:hypothetical protein
MTIEQKIIRAKVGLSQACKMMGYSRDNFYRFKEHKASTSFSTPSRNDR